MQVCRVYGVYECSNVDCASVGALQVCRQRMCVCDLLFSGFSSAYIIKSSLQPVGSSYTYISTYVTLLPLASAQAVLAGENHSKPRENRTNLQ